MPSITLTTTVENVARILATFRVATPQNEGESDEDYIKRVLIKRVANEVFNFERSQAASSVVETGDVIT